MDILPPYIAELGVGIIALYALILALRGRNQSHESTTALASKLVEVQESQGELAKQLVTVVAGFPGAVDRQTETLVQMSSQQMSLLTTQTQAIGAMTAKLTDDFMPQITTLFSDQKRQLAAEFRPVVEQLSSVYFSVREVTASMERQATQDTEMVSQMMAHHERVTMALSNVRLQQAELMSNLVQACDRIEEIFTRVMAEADAEIVEREDEAQAAQTPPAVVASAGVVEQVVTRRVPDELDRTNATKEGVQG